jgi:hypothetical protein
MAVIPNDPQCRFSFPFHGITAPTLIHALKTRVDEENGSLHGDGISGDVELDSIQGQIDLIYRIRDQLIDFYITRKGDFVECDKVAALLRQMVDEVDVSAKNDPNPRILEFVDEDEDEDEDAIDVDAEIDDDESEPVRSVPRPAPEPSRTGTSRTGTSRPSTPRQTPVVTPSIPSPRTGRALAEGMDGDTKRKLLITSAVVIVAVVGFVLMGRAPKET